MEEPKYNSVLLAIDLESLDFVDIWFRDDFNERPEGSGNRWYCTGDEASYPWSEVLVWARDAKCALHEMEQSERPAVFTP